MQLITTILGALFGGSGIASGATNIVKGATLVAMLPFIWKWYEGHANDVAVRFELNYSQIVFVLIIVFIVTWVAHKANPNREY